MTVTATSLKLPKRLKSRMGSRGALSAFLRDGMRADETMQQSGLGYEAEAVYACLEARVRGRKVRRPRPARWRE
jgi:hypothetical protein